MHIIKQTAIALVGAIALVDSGVGSALAADIPVQPAPPRYQQGYLPPPQAEVYRAAPPAVVYAAPPPVVYYEAAPPVVVYGPPYGYAYPRYYRGYRPYIARGYGPYVARGYGHRHWR